MKDDKPIAETCWTCFFFDGEKKCGLDDEKVSPDTHACEDYEEGRNGR